MTATQRTAALVPTVSQVLTAAGVESGDGVVVAVSGGVDSVVLLDTLHRLAPHLGLRLHVVHLDHQLRVESEADARFVADLAARLGLPATVETTSVADEARRSGKSVEQTGRCARYELLERVRLEIGGRWVALGHHADDQAETVLLRLLRGAGTTGLAAMSQVREDGVLRPLLSYRRDEILGYAGHRGLSWREDASNRDLSVPRNRVRHELLPHLRRHHCAAISTLLCRTAALLRDEDDYLEGQTRRASEGMVTERLPGCVSLDSAALRGYHIAVRRRLLRQYIQELAQGEPATFAVVEAADRLLCPDVSGLRSIGPQLRGQCVGDRLILRWGSPAPVHAPVVLPGTTEIPERRVTLRARFLPVSEFDTVASGLGKWRVAFDASVATQSLILRSPRPGDRLQPLGMGGRHKKLSDCFIDSKWPRILRPEALLLTRRTEGADESGEQVLWVAGLGRCDPYRVRPDSADILYLEFIH